MKRRHTYKTGFSLVEVMVALAVLIFGMFAVLDLFTNARNSLQRSEAKINTVANAQNKIEELKALGYNRLSDIIDPTADTSLYPPDPSEISDSVPTSSWQARLSRSKDNLDLIDIELTLSYKVPASTKEATIVLHDVVSK